MRVVDKKAKKAHRTDLNTRASAPCDMMSLMERGWVEKAMPA
jgi:hypothetical protein